MFFIQVIVGTRVYLVDVSNVPFIFVCLYRYCIHEMNVDAVMMCILPYYDTPHFLKTFKVCFHHDIQHIKNNV